MILASNKTEGENTERKEEGKAKQTESENQAIPSAPHLQDLGNIIQKTLHTEIPKGNLLS